MRIIIETAISITPHTADAWFLELPDRICEAIAEELQKISPLNQCQSNYFDIIRINMDELDKEQLIKLNNEERNGE